MHHLGFIKLHHFGEVAGFTGDQFGDTTGGGVADALPPGLHGIADHLGRAALEFVKLLVPNGKVVRQIALYHRFEQIFLGVEVQKSVPLETPARSATSSTLVAAKPFSTNRLNAASSNSCGRASLRRSRLCGESSVEGEKEEMGMLMTDWLVMYTAPGAKSIAKPQWIRSITGPTTLSKSAGFDPKRWQKAGSPTTGFAGVG